METCENCERVIGKLETPCLWEGKTVCLDCHDRLHRNAPPVSRVANYDESTDEFFERFKEEERRRLGQAPKHRPQTTPQRYDSNTEQAVTFGVLKAVAIVLLIIVILSLGIVILLKLGGH